MPLIKKFLFNINILFITIYGAYTVAINHLKYIIKKTEKKTNYRAAAVHMGMVPNIYRVIKSTALMAGLA